MFQNVKLTRLSKQGSASDYSERINVIVVRNLSFIFARRIRLQLFRCKYVDILFRYAVRNLADFKSQ